jgi:hypothetical protein
MYGADLLLLAGTLATNELMINESNRYEDARCRRSAGCLPLAGQGCLAYGATVRDRGAGSEAGWAGRCCTVG